MQRTQFVLSRLAAIVLPALAVVFPSSQSHAQINALGSFNGTDGSNPEGSLTLSGSTLYGTTYNGGAHGDGAIFSIPVAGGAPTLLGSFGGTANGANPHGSLTLSADGSKFYGTTVQGGANNDGAIFSVPVAGAAPTLLGSFNGSNGQQPNGSLTLIGSTLYGTASGGGPTYGAVFSIPTDGSANPAILGSFSYSSGTGPEGSLTLSGSTFYGTTLSGTSQSDGAIFSIPTDGSAAPTHLASFSGTANGEFPYGSLTLVGSTLYGTTESGGANGEGGIFSIPLTGGALTLLGSFNAGGTDGANPFGSLTLVGSNLYGTTYYGGANNDGAIFSIPLIGGVPTLVASFNGTNGQGPDGDLTLVGSTLYGTTAYGGPSGDGTAFSLAVVPEPSSIVLLVAGAIALVGAAALHRRMRRRAAL